MNMLTIYHGSDHKLLKPLFGFGKKDNDYGSGFYATLDESKAAEWAVSNGSDSAYINRYQIDTTGLNIIHLDDYGILAWIAEIVSHRGARGEASMRLANQIAERYKIDTSSADIIMGYRADDSYSDIIDSFLKNELNIDEVERLFKKGELGYQYFVYSEKAFSSLSFQGYKEVDIKSFTNTTEINARIEVSKFLKQRANQIQLNGYVPTGVIAREAANNTFIYHKEYNYYSTETLERNYANNIEEDEEYELDKS